MTEDMSLLAPCPDHLQWIALHGLAMQVPKHWDLVAQQGQRQDGAWRFADDQRPALQVSWSSRPAHLERTLRTAARKVGQQTGATLHHQEACGGNGLLAEMRNPDHPDDRLHIAIVQFDSIWVIWRQITPGPKQ